MPEAVSAERFVAEFMASPVSTTSPSVETSDAPSAADATPIGLLFTTARLQSMTVAISTVVTKTDTIAVLRFSLMMLVM